MGEANTRNADRQTLGLSVGRLNSTGLVDLFVSCYPCISLWMTKIIPFMVTAEHRLTSSIYLAIVWR